MSKKNRDRVVYSTEHGRMCPECGHALDRCACSKNQAPPPGDGVARLRREVRRGKDVTTIAGLPLELTELKELAKALKKKCGVGGTVKDFVIEIQGDHRDTIETELLSLGYRVKRSGG